MISVSDTKTSLDGELTFNKVTDVFMRVAHNEDNRRTACAGHEYLRHALREDTETPASDSVPRQFTKWWSQNRLR